MTVTGNFKPTRPATLSQPTLPEAFTLQDSARLDDRLVVCQTSDKNWRGTARVWLESVEGGLAEYRWRAERWQELNHPNLLPVYRHWATADKESYAVAVAVPVGDFVPLRSLLAGPVNLVLTANIIRQLALALDHCHSQGIWHLHLQPAFIWLGKDGLVRLEPFAARPGYYTPKVEPAVWLTPYCSPEQLHGVGDRRSDVYGLALLAYELLAGFNPFRAASEEATCRLINQKELRSLSELNPAVSPQLAAAIERGLSHDPARRFESVLSFLAYFEAGLLTSRQDYSEATVEALVASYQETAEQAFNFPKTHSSPPRQLQLNRPPAHELALLALPPASEPSLSPKPAKPGPVQFWLRFLRWFLVLDFLAFWVLIGLLVIPALLPRANPPVEQVTPTTVPVSLPVAPDPPTVNPTPADRWSDTLKTAREQAFNQGHFDEAIKLYQSVMARDSEYAPAYRDLGEVLFWSSRERPGLNALDTLKKAVALKSDDALAWAYLALAYQDAYQYDKGLDAALQAYKLDPQSAEAMAAQALLISRTGDDGRANQTIEQAAQRAPSNLAVLWARSLLYKKAGDWASAGQTLDILVQTYPKLALFSSAKGDLLRAQGGSKAQEAMTWYRQALGLDDQLPNAYAGLGLLYYGQGDYSQAEQNLKKALDLRPSYATSLTGLGYLKLAQRQYDAALTAFNGAILQDSREAEAYNGLAATYLDQGNYRQVDSWAALAIKYAPRYADPYYNQARALYELKDYPKAVTLFEQAVKLAPVNARYYEGLAFAAYAAGDKAKATQAARQGLQLAPDNSNLAELLKRLGN